MTDYKRRTVDIAKREECEFLDKMARLCGWQGTMVYMSLCRHSYSNQECYISVKEVEGMAEEHEVDTLTIITGLETLEERKVVTVENTGGRWTNNVYILLDKSEWNCEEELSTEF